MAEFDADAVNYWGEVLSKTSFGNYVQKIDGLSEAFILDDRSIRCIDEGCCGGLRMAGSGILYQDNAPSALNGKVDGIYSHEECGAAALYAKQNGLDTSDTDQYGIKWAQELAQQLGVPYKGHIGIDEMVRPSGKHIAWVTYYDGSGQFDPARLDSLPPGFVISRSLLDSDYAKQELAVSISIALGAHGLGDVISPETPFVVVPIGKSGSDSLALEVLTSEAEEIASQFGGKVVVSGFTAPL